VTTAPELFDLWARDGRAEGMERGHFARAEPALEAMGIQPGQKCLDVGCGNGWATRWMRRKAGPYGFAAGVDAAPEMIERAKAHTEESGVQYRCTDFARLPWKEAFFDHAFSMEALYYAPDLGAALAAIAHVVRPGGGIAVVTDFYGENPGCHSWPADLGLTMTLLDEAGWAAALEAAGFSVTRTWRSLDPRPADPSWSPERAERELAFRRDIGSLVLQGVRA
jgi:ubiquinone/menaquinone biosynthesis C-methylase UbiE